MDVNGEVASLDWVEIDFDNRFAIPWDGGWDVGESERANLDAIGSLVGRHKCSSLRDDAVIQTLHSEDTISHVRKYDRLCSSTIILINNDAIEGNNVWIHGQQRIRRSTNTFQRDRRVGRIFDITLAGTDRYVD